MEWYDDMPLYPNKDVQLQTAAEWLNGEQGKQISDKQASRTQADSKTDNRTDSRKHTQNKFT